MNSPENQIIAQYAMLKDKVIEFENEIKIKKARIDQEINKIEAYNNIFLKNEKDGSSLFSQTEKSSESIIRVAPILEPSLLNGFENNSPSIQLHDTLIKQTNQFEIKFLATQPIRENISLLDIHTFHDSICIGSDGLLRIYCITDGSVVFNWDFSVGSCQNNITCIANIDKTDFFAVGFEDGFVRILNISSIVVSEFPVSNDPLSTIFYSSKQILFCYSKNHEVSCWKGENNCLQTNVFEENIIYFKEIEDDQSNDIYIISENLNMYRWDTQNNDFILIEENAGKTLEGEKAFSISAEENLVKIIPSESDESSILSFDLPEYSLFDKNDSYFCFSAGKRFSLYKVIMKNPNIPLLHVPNTSSSLAQPAEPLHEEEEPVKLTLSKYMIGSIDPKSIQNQPHTE